MVAFTATKAKSCFPSSSSGPFSQKTNSQKKENEKPSSEEVPFHFWRPESGIFFIASNIESGQKSISRSALKRAVVAAFMSEQMATRAMNYLIEISPNEFSSIARKLDLNEESLLKMVELAMIGIQPFPDNLLQKAEKLLRDR